MRLPLLATALLALAPAPRDEARTCAAGDVLREWKGDSTGISGEGYRVIRDTEAWEKFWREHRGGATPRVDFGREMVLAVFPREQVEIAWMRVTNAGRPGLSRFWIGLCPSPRRWAYHIAVVGRSDLAVEFWTKDEGIVPVPGQEPVRGGHGVDLRLVRGAAPVWMMNLPPLTDEEKREAEFYLARLGADDIDSRDQGLQGLLRLGARVRALVEPLLTSTDPEMRGRAAKFWERTPTFDLKTAPRTREQAVFLAREHLALHLPALFSNDPEMRWQDDGARSATSSLWEVKLKYL